MKKIVALLATVVMLAGVASASIAQPTPKKILMLGASTTACVGTPSPDKCYTNIMKAARPDDQLTVLARPGNTLASTTPEGNWLNVEIPGGHDVVFMQLGLNDWRHNIDHATFRSHADQFLARVRAANPNAKLYWLSTWIPQYWPPTPDTWGKLWQDYGVQIVTALRVVNGEELIDMGPSGTRRESVSYINPDGVHPNVRGHRRMADELLARI